MANLPQAFSVGVGIFGGEGGMSSLSSSVGAPPYKDRKMQSVEQLVLVLCDLNLHENALLKLFKKKELFPNLAPLLWHSFGLREIVSIYPLLLSPSLTPVQSNRVCNALALLQSVASHPHTRKSFLNDRFSEVAQVLGNMVGALAEQPSSRLLKHIIRCYLRLSDEPRACKALKICLPNMLRDDTFSSCLREDPITRRWLQQLLLNVNGNRVALLLAGAFDRML